MIKQIAKEIYKEIMTPTAHDDTAYNRGSQSVWHGVLGGCFAIITGSVLLVFAAYLLKEIFDYRAGATLADCIEDLVSTVVGAVSVAVPFWYPFIVMATGSTVFIYHVWDQVRNPNK